MRPVPPSIRQLPLLALLVAALPAAAQRADSASFIIRLGADTTAIERYVRAGDRLDAISVSRSPRTTVRRLTVWFAADGSVARFATGGARGAMNEQTPGAAGVIPLVGAFYVPWELALTQAHQSGEPNAEAGMLMGRQVTTIAMRRTGDRTWSFNNQFDQPVLATLDAEGRMLSFAIQGGGTTVERTGWIDIDALAADFAARDQAGRGMGPLSPRDSTTTSTAGARITIDYGRPSLRGRDLQVLVPHGQVWRVGANAATRLSSDRPLRIGDLDLEPGDYSIFAIPGPDSWTLIVNSRTGMSGLDRDPDLDLGRVPMTVRQLDQHIERFTIAIDPTPDGGVIRLRWGRTEASVPFRISG